MPLPPLSLNGAAEVRYTHTLSLLHLLTSQEQLAPKRWTLLSTTLSSPL